MTLNRIKSYIKTFEEFTDEELKKLYIDGKTYVTNTLIDINKKEYYELFDENNVNKGKELLEILKKYDISHFEYQNVGFGVKIFPDIVFQDYILELNYILKEPIDVRSLNLFISIDRDDLNKTDFEKGIPVILRGLGLGVKIFELICSKEKIITANRYSTIEFINLWNGLLKNKKLYCFTSNMMSGCIYKNISNDELLKIYNEVNLRIKNVVCDSKIQKIINL